jgi:hypothetical protein
MPVEAGAWGGGHEAILASSCRTGPLRVGRAFARLFNCLDEATGIGPPAGRNHHSRPTGGPERSSFQDRYTHHEVVAPRAVGPSAGQDARLRG